MPVPGAEVISRQSPPSGSQPISTGAWFIAGLADRGPVTSAGSVYNLDSLKSLYGDEISFGLVNTAGDIFFQEGGKVLNVIRVVGPAAKAATKTMKNGAEAPANTLKVSAANPGEWGNKLTVKAVEGEDDKIKFEVFESGVLKQVSKEFETNAEAVEWFRARAKYIVLEDLGQGLPAVGEVTLAEGADDRASITDAHWKAALAKFGKGLGLGQVSMPGRTTTAAHEALLEHAEAFNRRALVDGSDTADVATLLGEVEDARIEAAIKGGLFGSWYEYQGVARGVTRDVPPSAVIAGLIAKTITEGKSPNTAAAGELAGQAQHALGLTQEFTDADRELLNEGGVNVAVMANGLATNMGFRTIADPEEDDTWELLSNVGLYMELAYKLQKVGDRYAFAEIDGKGKVFAKFQGELTGVCMPYYNEGSLYGAEPQEAFVINTGPEVNTIETIEGREILAVVEVKMSEFGEFVKIYVTKRSLSEGI